MILKIRMNKINYLKNTFICLLKVINLFNLVKI
jgi:hypothetical protein